MSESSTRWYVPTGTGLSWRSWNGEFVVYHRQSGDTHRLNATAAQVLKLLERSAANAQELTDDIARAAGTEADPDFRSRIDQLLSQFREWGLIEPIDDRERPPHRGSR